MWLTFATILLITLVIALFPLPVQATSPLPNFNVLSFDFNPKVIDTARSSQTITFTMGVTATRPNGMWSGGGATATQLRFTNRPTNFSPPVLFPATPPVLISGDAFSGTLQNTMTMPQGSESGTWTLYFLTLADQNPAQNHVDLDSNDMKAINVNFPTTFVVKYVYLFPLIRR